MTTDGEDFDFKGETCRVIGTGGDGDFGGISVDAGVIGVIPVSLCDPKALKSYVPSDARLINRFATLENDGYDAVQVGFMNSKPKHTTKPLAGHFNKNNVKPAKVLAEFQQVPKFDYKPGQVFNVTLFNKGDFVIFKPGSKHNSHTKNGCLLIVFMRGINKLI